MPPTSNLISAFLSAPTPSRFNTSPLPKRSCITIFPATSLLSNKFAAPGLLETGFNFRMLMSDFGSFSVTYFGGAPAIGLAKRNFDLSMSPKISLSIIGL